MMKMSMLKEHCPQLILGTEERVVDKETFKFVSIRLCDRYPPNQPSIPPMLLRILQMMD